MRGTSGAIMEDHRTQMDWPQSQFPCSMGDAFSGNRYVMAAASLYY